MLQDQSGIQQFHQQVLHSEKYCPISHTHTSGDSAGSNGSGGHPVSQPEPITIDDDLNQPLSTILGGPLVGQPQVKQLVSPKEERDSGAAAVPPVSSNPEAIEVSSDQGYIDEQAPESVRERRIAEARKVIGLKPKKQLKDAQGQSDMIASEDLRTQGVPAVI